MTVAFRPKGARWRKPPETFSTRMAQPHRSTLTLLLAGSPALTVCGLAACEQLIGLEPGELRATTTTTSTSTTGTPSQGGGGVGGAGGSGGHASGGSAGAAGGSAVVVLAIEQPDPLMIAVDETNVYWTNEASSGSVVRVSIDGGSPTVIAGGQQSPVGIGVDSTYVYWAAEENNEVRYAPKDGQEALLFAQALPASHPTGLAVDATKVVWTEWGDGYVRSGTTPPPPTITQLDAYGGTDGMLGAVAMAGDYAYWLNNSNGSVARQLLQGGGTRDEWVPGGTADGYWGIAVSGTIVYLTNETDGTVTWFDANLPMAPQHEIAAGQVSPRGIAVDGNFVYWANGAGGGEGSIQRWQVPGGPIQILAPGQDGPAGIAVDSANVYWTNLAGGTVAKVSKEPR
jgi:hypothetical protein